MNHASLLWPRLLAFVVFLISVNLLSGYLAITLDYPSLFNVNASFGEYAIPLPFTWAMTHWPTMLIYGIPLLYHTSPEQKLVFYYRLYCAVTFCLLMLELDAKIPFLLFPKVDAVIGLVLSLALVPPTRTANPILFPVVCLAIVAILSTSGYFAYDYWQHRTPELRTTTYADGNLELTAININKVLHEMRIEMDLKTRLDSEESCALGQQAAEKVKQDYPFDNEYRKIIEVWFNPANQDLPENNGKPYPLGEISLNDAHRDPDGKLACYLSYKK